MFEGGVPDQFHQFTSAASRTQVRPPPPPPHHHHHHHHLSSFPPPPLHHHHHGSSTNTTANFAASFDPYNTLPPPLQPNFLHPSLHHHQHQGSSTLTATSKNNINGEKQQSNNNSNNNNNNDMVAMNLEMERDHHHPHHHRHQRSMPESDDPWSNEEVLALLRIRSSLENWFPEFTWEHVSRKLGELGFKRSAEKCKEMFEEESRCFNNINYSKNYRVFSELEELCHHQDNHHQTKPPDHEGTEKNKKEQTDKPCEAEDKMGQNLEEDSTAGHQYQAVENPQSEGGNGKEVDDRSKSKKRKRQKKKLEMFRRFCEQVVNKMMAHQEEMHRKLLQDMVKRDEEKFAREEAWKKQEMDRINKELEVRAHEQALAGDRQATIIKFLQTFTSSLDTGSSGNHIHGDRSTSAQDLVQVPNTSSHSTTSSSLVLSQSPSPTPACQTNNQSGPEAASSSSLALLGHQKFSTSQSKVTNPVVGSPLPENQASQNPNSNPAPKVQVPTSGAVALAPQNPNNTRKNPSSSAPSSVATSKVVQKKSSSTNDIKEDIGKRWPREEVLALIKLRCSMFQNNEDKDGKLAEVAAAKAPLWERISQGMSKLGYKRSAKRCKEKWENINKYFRKTKDVNKKRPVDSRTCPYFHQLRTLYSQEKLVSPNEEPENRPTTSLENRSSLPENRAASSCQDEPSNSSRTNLDRQGDKNNMVQVAPPPPLPPPPPPAFDFEF